MIHCSGLRSASIQLSNVANSLSSRNPVVSSHNDGSPESSSRFAECLLSTLFMLCIHMQLLVIVVVVVVVAVSLAIEV